MSVVEIGPGHSGRPGRLLFPIIAVLAVLLFARAIARFAIDIEWWRELGQLSTYWTLMWWGALPALASFLVVYAALWVAHARGMKRAGTGLRQHRLYSWLASFGLLLVALIASAGVVDSWTVMQFFGSRGLGLTGATFQDPVFGRPLLFYLFDLPFYRMLLSAVLVPAILACIVYLVTHAVWLLQRQGSRAVQQGPGGMRLDLSGVDWRSGLGSRFLRTAVVLLLLALAGDLYLSRYALLTESHGQLLTGLDYTDEHIRLPLIWLKTGACLLCAAAIALGRWTSLFLIPVVYFVAGIVPPLVGSLYVRPNELSLERPYIQRHLEATRSAFGLDRRVTTVDYQARLDGTINVAQNRALLDNVRLWDWQAFHDTVTQIQALRPYYVFHDTDIDRYTIDGQRRQVLLTPRELNVNQLSGTRANFINSHFIYTHGYGVVMAEANQIAPDGLPVPLIQNAPPEVKTASLTLKRPELYYGEVTHEPVFVRTSQREFNYPSGEENVHTTYTGRGGFPISSLPLRLAAALREGNWNIVLTGYLTSESRMMIRRDVRTRLRTVAGFLHWDEDPYLVLTPDGRLVWLVDGYTTSDAHPYSRMVSRELFGEVNYIRNSVKAAVDAYDGTTTLYVFDEADPIIRAYQQLFPALLHPASQMPADLREHVRYPEMLFSAQAEIYRTYHMRDPEAFYNKEDLWDVARQGRSQEAAAETAAATYVMASLPGEKEPEFVLLLPFTPRGKDNLTAIMAARCDGPHLGELVVLRLSKQSLIYGPLQVEARINQDGNISKDLTLWNQQGSRVVRGQMLVLPVDNTFLYVEPLYIQAAQARMPELKKIAMAAGNTLIYTDSYDQALRALEGASGGVPAASPPAAGAPATTPSAPVNTPMQETRLVAAREHMRRYRELLGQGKFAEAGRELELLAESLR